MAELKTFYYNHQMRDYLIQFMAIFAGMQVQVGWNEDKEPRLIRVPIKNASMDRVVADIKGENTQNKPIRLPIMSAWMQTPDLAPETRKGVATHRRNTVMPTGGVFPTDLKVVEQRMPVPYRVTFELGIWASNQDQHYQILEQILVLFDPGLQIQTSDEPLDMKKLTSIELVGIRPEENMPAGADRRLIQTSLEFQATVYLSVPADVHQRIVNDIFMRVGAVSQMAQSSQDIIADLDSQGIEYEQIFSGDDVDIGDEP